MKNIYFYLPIFLLLASLVFFPQKAFSIDDGFDDPPISIDDETAENNSSSNDSGAGPRVRKDVVNPLAGAGFSDLGDVFGFTINLILGVGYALVFVMLALGFVQYIMSRGDKQATDSAQHWLTYALVGGIGLFFISVIKSVMENITGGSLNNTGGNLSPF